MTAAVAGIRGGEPSGARTDRAVPCSPVPCRACRRDGGALQQGGDPRPSEEAHRVGAVAWPGEGQRGGGGGGGGRSVTALVTAPVRTRSALPGGCPARQDPAGKGTRTYTGPGIPLAWQVSGSPGIPYAAHQTHHSLFQQIKASSQNVVPRCMCKMRLRRVGGFCACTCTTAVPVK